MSVASENNLTEITRAGREKLLGQRGCVVWITGLSGSGKSTIASALVRRLLADQHLAYILDGDQLREGLCADLGYGGDARAENVRRAGEVAGILADAGAIVIAAFISPYRAGRDQIRARCGSGRFMEVFLDVPLSACEGRDPKGLYARARAGKIHDFTGIDSPYEAPLHPELTLPTHQLSLEACVDELLRAIQKLQPWPAHT